MDVNSHTLDATQSALRACYFSTCPARDSQSTGEFRSNFLRNAVFNTRIDRATEPSFPKFPGQFCAHEGNAHGPRHLRDLRAHTPVFPHHLRAHTTTTSCAQTPSSCAQRLMQPSLARCATRAKHVSEAKVAAVISLPESSRLRPSLAAYSSERSIRRSALRETALDRWRWGHYLSRPRRKSFHGTDSQNNRIVSPDRFGSGCKNLYIFAEKRSCGTWSISVKSRPRFRPSMDAQRLNRAAQ